MDSRSRGNFSVARVLNVVFVASVHRASGINVDKVVGDRGRRRNQGRNHLYSGRLENVQGTRRSLQLE